MKSNCPLIDHDLKFDEKTHKYWLASDPAIKFTSATTFIKQFFAPFNAKKIAANLVATNPKYQSYTVEELLAEWQQSGTHGTKVHNEIEKFILGDLEKDSITEKKAELGVGYIEDVFDMSSQLLYPEVKVYSKKYRISGTIDLLAYDPNTDRYVILDWKTNKKIATSSYGGKTGIKKPTRFIEDCNYNVYSLQMSLYRFILEQEYNIDVRRQILVHLKPTKKEIYMTPYLKDVISDMLNYHLQQLKT